MRGGLGALLLALALIWAGPAPAAPFSDWAAVVVAGDWKGSEGGPTEAFDNARRDVARALVRAGFEPARIGQFSVRPGRYADTRPQPSEPRRIYETLSELSAAGAEGCLFYVSSHGLPQGVVIGERIVPPPVMASMLDRACGKKPTVVVISACFSGVFVPHLAAPNRMILTAARRDRTSFGCGEADRYPYFDECFLQSIDRSAGFPALATAVRRCVAEREVKEGASPPSEPQVFVGAELSPVLPLLSFAAPAGRDN
ncbi:C13 family peptidase [Phenylobacterium sp.]|uniref:C13 family peptidase n=1 Tax=Phenylobacterium sp. TaxID=1871053 RepID=UPI002E35F221|nr:C13 family peptidase [Phenylobacterium sp.]HEX2560523.1 C13 family peptidase [Phenylobacterium sp.]